MAKRHTPEYIEPTPKEYEYLKEQLIRHFNELRQTGLFKGDVILKATQVLEDSKKGWTNCPKSYEDRVRIKGKWRHPGASNLLSWGANKRSKAAKELAVEKALEDSGNKSGLMQAEDEVLVQIGRDQILKKLGKEDKKFWLAREKYYRKEFEFNDSSDFALLMELLSDELEHKRIINLRLTSEDPESLAHLSKAGTECFLRMERTMKALGITREQRKGELDSGEGDIASLSLSLDKKLTMLQKMKELDEAERIEYLGKKHARGDTFIIKGLPRPVHNRIPDLEEIMKLEEEMGIVDVEQDKGEGNGKNLSS